MLWKLNTTHQIYTQSTVGRTKFGTISAYCNFMFKKKYTSATGAYKLFFINEKANDGGIADEKVKAACVFKESYNNGSSTAMHELLHCFELPHSFSDESKYFLRKYHTDNILDYSNNKTNDIRKSLWYWQIKEVWEHLKK